MEDTIAAISTPIGAGGIAIIRISGPQALEIADKVFVSKRGCPSTFSTHTIHYGRIASNGNTLDQVMLTVMRAPRTYTTEDVVEINCHGGVFTARSILALCLQRGARLAEPGEFTKRAFINGRIDLTQAESVMDVIRSQTDRAQMAATNAMEGRLYQKIEQVRTDLITILAHIEAYLDFSEEEIQAATCDQLKAGVESVLEQLEKLHTTAKQGRILRDGAIVTIIGRPNAGKSSLMNALLGHERSIVTHVPGTTRDTIEDIVNINDIPVRLHDTAGFREARGRVESIGIKRSVKQLTNSDLLLHVYDSSRPYADQDRQLEKIYARRTVIRVLNKIDKKNRIRIPDHLNINDFVGVSSVLGDGLHQLRTRIAEVLDEGMCHENTQDVLVNDRQNHALILALKEIRSAVGVIMSNADLEIASHHLRLSLNVIGEITGRTDTEDILDSVFKTFCIGK